MSATPLLVIAGPTGVGKTRVAVALAQRVPIEVVSADSRQVYRGMDAATGKPTPEERASARHHLVDVVEPRDRYHAARFRREASTAIEEIRARGRFPVVVGGTGLYIRALLRGLDEAPPADAAFRRELDAVMASEGRAALHARLARHAPEVAQRLHPHDHVRVVRALEILRAGPTRRERWAGDDDEYAALYVGLTMDRAELGRRLRARCRAMVAAGLRAEVERLLAEGYEPSLPAMQGIGYRDFVRVVRGEIDEAEALRRMERDTLRYAKRQWTWFARERDVEWIDVRTSAPEAIAVRIEERLKRRMKEEATTNGMIEAQVGRGGSE